MSDAHYATYCQLFETNAPNEQIDLFLSTVPAIHYLNFFGRIVNGNHEHRVEMLRRAFVGDVRILLTPYLDQYFLATKDYDAIRQRNCRYREMQFFLRYVGRSCDPKAIEMIRGEFGEMGYYDLFRGVIRSDHPLENKKLAVNKLMTFHPDKHLVSRIIEEEPQSSDRAIVAYLIDINQ